MRCSGVAMEIASVCEVNPKRTGHHIHALQHGDFVDRQLAEHYWHGFVKVKAIESLDQALTSYTVKAEAARLRTAGYELKSQEGRARPVNFTRGYFKGRTLEQVRSDVRGLMFENATGSGTWVRVNRELSIPTASSWLTDRATVYEAAFELKRDREGQRL